MMKEKDPLDGEKVTEAKKVRDHTDGCVYADTCQSFNCMGSSCDVYSLTEVPGITGKVIKDLDTELLIKRYKHSDKASDEKHLPGFVKQMMQINETRTAKERKGDIDKIKNTVYARGKKDVRR